MGRIIVQPPGNTVEQIVLFTYASGTLVLQQVSAGDIIDSAWIRVDTVFNDPAASAQLGTTVTPGLVFAAVDTALGDVAQYANLATTEFVATDYLVLAITPGTATRGAGALIYRYRRGS